MSDNKTLLNKLREILNIPVATVEETKVVETKAEEKKTEEIKPEESKVEAKKEVAPATEIQASEQKPEVNPIELMLSAVADLQSRLANLEAQITTNNESYSKLQKVVEVISKEPSGEAPKRTAGEFSSGLLAFGKENSERLEQLEKKFGRTVKPIVS